MRCTSSSTGPSPIGDAGTFGATSGGPTRGGLSRMPVVARSAKFVRPCRMRAMSASVPLMPSRAFTRAWFWAMARSPRTTWPCGVRWTPRSRFSRPTSPVAWPRVISDPGTSCRGLAASICDRSGCDAMPLRVRPTRCSWPAWEKGRTTSRTVRAAGTTAPTPPPARRPATADVTGSEPVCVRYSLVVFAAAPAIAWLPGAACMPLPIHDRKRPIAGTSERASPARRTAPPPTRLPAAPAAPSTPAEIRRSLLVWGYSCRALSAAASPRRLTPDERGMPNRCCWGFPRM